MPQVTHYVCDELDDHEYDKSGAAALNLVRVSEAFFVDSIKIGSLRLVKSYVVALKSAVRGAKRGLEDTTASSTVVKAKKKAAPAMGRPRVDQYCPIGEGGRVLQSDGCFWSATLNQTNLSANNNKFYLIQAIEMDDGTFMVWNRWGRQGYSGQNNMFADLSLAQAKAMFCKKFSEKTRNPWPVTLNDFVEHDGKYTLLDMDLTLEDDEEVEEVSTKPRKGVVARSAMDVDPQSAPKSAANTSLTLAKPSGSATGCKLDPRLADLVEMIFDKSMMAKTVAAMNYDVKKQPLGKLSKLTIKKALGVLKEIEEVLTSGKSSHAAISDCSNRFYTLIPHSSGKMRLPYIDNLVILQEKLDLLDTLNEIDAAAKLKKQDEATGDESVHPIDRNYQQLNLKLVPLDRNSEKWQVLSKWVAQTHAPTHTDYKLKILDIFEVDRPKDRQDFVAYEDLHNQMLLWHGSRMSNWVGILSQGLRIAPPEAPVTGYMFGKGVYFADIVSKSANYCATNKKDNIGFLMACQVALGDTYDKTAAEFVNKLSPRYQSCRGVGLSHPDPKEAVTIDDGVTVPLGKLVPNPDIDESDLLYNEFIVYDIAQIKFKYFFKFQFMYK